MTLGIEDPDTYYYRRLFVDAVHAVSAAQDHPAIDASRIVISGGSQGGGITLATAALTQRVNGVPPVAAIVDVPFLAHMRRATEIVDTAPYAEISRYLGTRRNDVDAVFRTLSYFDGVNFAARKRPCPHCSPWDCSTTCARRRASSRRTTTMQALPG